MTVGNTTGRNNKALKRVDATIASGASLSDAIDIGTGELVGIVMPAAWTAADITFAATIDGTNFLAVNDAAGSEVSVVSPAADKFIILSYAGVKGLNKVKIRSGTVGSPVVQGGSRTITLLIKEE